MRDAVVAILIGAVGFGIYSFIGSGSSARWSKRTQSAAELAVLGAVLVSLEVVSHKRLYAAVGVAVSLAISWAIARRSKPNRQDAHR